MLLNGYDRTRLEALGQLKGPRITKPPAVKSMLLSWEPAISGRKLAFKLELDRSNGKPKCSPGVQDAYTKVLWDTVVAKHTNTGAGHCPVSLHYYPLGEKAFRAEAASKLLNWWSQSKSEAAKMKEKWFEEQRLAAENPEI